MKFNLIIHIDNTVDWIGVDAGKTIVVADNPKSKLIALKISGSNFSNGDQQQYGPAHFMVSKYEVVDKREQETEICINGVLGDLHWNVRPTRY